MDVNRFLYQMPASHACFQVLQYCRKSGNLPCYIIDTSTVAGTAGLALVQLPKSPAAPIGPQTWVS